MAAEIGWGVVGTGAYVQNYIAEALNEATGARLVAFQSRDRARGEAIAAKYGARRSYTAFGEMLEDPEIAAVYVASPNHLHAEHTVAAARAGKHVLCEKPMALTVQECDAMIDASREHGVKLGVGFENRHHPVHIELRRLVASGDLGHIAVVTAQYSRWLQRPDTGWRANPALSGGGSIMGLGVHCLDIVRFVLGDDPEEVVAMTDEATGGRVVDEIVLALMRFASGTFSQVISGINVPRSHNDIVLYGEGARAHALDTIGAGLQGALEITTDERTTRTTHPVTKLGAVVRQIEAFQRSIHDGSDPNASGEDGRRMVVLTDAILKSSREGTAVRLAAAAG